MIPLGHHILLYFLFLLIAHQLFEISLMSCQQESIPESQSLRGEPSRGGKVLTTSTRGQCLARDQ